MPRWSTRKSLRSTPAVVARRTEVVSLRPEATDADRYRFHPLVLLLADSLPRTANPVAAGSVPSLATGRRESAKSAASSSTESSKTCGQELTA